MACCGGAQPRRWSTGQGAVGQPPSPFVAMEYTGTTGMTVVGPRSGRVYRFDRPGARLQVDLRDVPGLRTVPRLKRL